ncbi:MAG: RagB/SusD family nutrient uptake outer membrane protein [Pedobacter sp.]
MKKRYTGIMILISCLTLTACNKFLDVAPKGKTTLNTVNDFDLWLGNRFLGEVSGIPQICWMTDHVQKIPWQPDVIAEGERAYIWAEQLTDADASPKMLSGAYHHIYYFNTVLENIDAASGGSIEQKRQLKAEALLGRAHEYFYLINLYGKPYDASTAATDLAVPFVVSADINTQTPPRATVKQLYEYIIGDLNAAIIDLPANNAGNRFRGSVHAAYSVLARVYLYMRNYSEAAKYAQLSLQRPGGAAVTNYNGVVKGVFPRTTRLNEIIYARGSDPTSGSIVNIADSTFIKSFMSTDLRLALTFYEGTASPFNYNTVKPSAGVRFSATANGYYDIPVGTTVAEMKLIIAENAIRNNDLTGALTQLNEIRVNRFAPANYQALISSNQKEVFEWVLRERRYEMPMNGLRWFDMRRLDYEGLMPEINRIDQSKKIIATLAPHSPRYTLQIPLNATVFNPGMPINP